MLVHLEVHQRERNLPRNRTPILILAGVRAPQIALSP